MRDFCALPRNDPSREARNGWIGANAAFCSAAAVSEITRWESAVGSEGQTFLLGASLVGSDA